MDGRPQLTATRALLTFLLIAGAAIFFARGPWRAVTIGNVDFAMIYSSARAWMLGRNPYEAADIRATWLQAGGAAQSDPAAFGSAVFLYPPPTFAALAPIAALPWRTAAFAWMALSTIAWFATLLAVSRAAGFGPRSLSRLAFFTAGVWLAPAATSLNVGQLAIASGAAVALAHSRGSRDSWLRGVLLGLGAAIKPQVAGLFTLYEAGRLRWKAAAASIATVAVITAIAVLRMQAAGIAWRASWLRNLHEFTTLSNGDPTAANPLRFHLINLHYPLHTLTDNRDLVRWAVLAIVAALCAAYFLVDLKRGRAPGEHRRTGGELISLSMVAVVTLMVVYHRFYDAVLLVWPLALAIRTIAAPGRDRALGLALLVLVGLYFLPGAAALASAAQRGWIPARLTTGPLWNALALPHEAWALPCMAVLLIALRWRAEPDLRRRST